MPVCDEDTRVLYAIKVGEVFVNGAEDDVEVIIRHDEGMFSNDRTWYDGVGYVLVSDPLELG